MYEDHKSGWSALSLVVALYEFKRKTRTNSLGMPVLLLIFLAKDSDFLMDSFWLSCTSKIMEGTLRLYCPDVITLGKLLGSNIKEARATGSS